MFVIFLITLTINLTRANCISEVCWRAKQGEGSFYGPANLNQVTATSEQTRAPVIPLCELAARPRRYAGKIIRTAGIIVKGSEQSFLYDPRCNSLENFVWVEYEPTYRSSGRVTRTYRRLMAHKDLSYDAGRARVMFVGRFDGPGGKRYGHLDGFLLQLRVTQIQQVRPVPESTPWPLPNVTPGSILEADETVRTLNDIFVFHVAGGTPSKEYFSPEILADDFSFTDANGRRTSKKTVLGLAAPYSGIIKNREIRVYVTDSTALATGILEKLQEDTIVEKQRYENRFVLRSEGWQLLSSRFKRLYARP